MGEAVASGPYLGSDGYRAIRQGAALVDLADRHLVRVSGRHWQRFLHGMLTADIKKLPVGGATLAVLVDPTGSYLADFGVLRYGEGCLLDFPGSVGEAAVATLRRYVLALNVTLEDASGDWALVSVQGPRAAEVLDGAGWPAAGLDAPFAARGPLEGGAQWMIRRTRTGELGFDLWVSRPELSSVRERVLAAGAEPADAASLRIARIEAGLPEPPDDIDARVIPLEVPLRHGISLSKGCYTGQETLAKMAHRGEPRRLLMGLEFDDAAPAAEPNSPVFLEGKKVGWIGSVAESPALGKRIALAHIKRAAAEPGARVSVVPATDNAAAAAAAAAATIRALPLFWGSGAAFPVPEY